MKEASLCLYAGYTPGNGEPRVLPISQSTTFTYASTAEVSKLFDLEAEGFFYTRLGNPTVDAVEKKIAALEGGVGALCTASGQAANMLAVRNLARSGDHIVSTASIYGGTFNLFAVTLKRMGIEVTFVDQHASDEAIAAAIRPETKAVFGETLSNPSMDVLDIERLARLAHAHGLPLDLGNNYRRPGRFSEQVFFQSFGVFENRIGTFFRNSRVGLENKFEISFAGLSNHYLVSDHYPNLSLKN